jgi:hypothetical protein
VRTPVERVRHGSNLEERLIGIDRMGGVISRRSAPLDRR